MSGLYKIRQAYSSFTATEKKIAEYIEKNREKVIESSSQELAKITGTSASAWVRFAKKLDYKGITALKVDLAKEKDENGDMFNVVISENDSIETMIKKVNSISIATIDQTYKLLNSKTLKDAISYILNSKNIFLAGVGGSGIICNDFMQKLTRINRNVIYHEDSHILMARVAHIKKEDVIIAVSYSGETESVNNVVSYAKIVGTPVIAITQYNVKSTLAKLSDLTFYTPVEEKELRLGSISSRNAAFVITDLLYYGVAKNNTKQTKEDLIATRRIIHPND